MFFDLNQNYLNCSLLRMSRTTASLQHHQLRMQRSHLHREQLRQLQQLRQLPPRPTAAPRTTEPAKGEMVLPGIVARLLQFSHNNHNNF